MAKEIERKFLLRALPSFSRADYFDIDQGYLSIDPVVRVRHIVSHVDTLAPLSSGILTLKYATKVPGIRDEFEYPIPPEEARIHLDKCGSCRLWKQRYVLPAGHGLFWEVDVFGGKLQGLIVAEIETPEGFDPDRVELPSWIGKDVTADPAFQNTALCLANHPPISDF